MLDLQKANMLKRISAALCDFIAISIVIIGVAFLLSFVLGFDGQRARLEEISDSYNVDLDLSSEEYQAFSEEEKKAYEDNYKAFSEDAEANYIVSLLINYSFIIITVSTLVAFLLLEFLVPLLLGDGQTLGKKVFSVAVMHENHVKITPIALFARSILGKCTIETLVPVYLIIMMFFGGLDLITGIIVLLGMLILQLVMIFTTRTRSTIHDLLSHTVCVDYASQFIFDNAEALARYKAERAREAAEQLDN